MTRPDVDEATRVFRALSDPTRYRIVQILAQRGEVSCAELGDAFPLSAPALSHHFRILRDSGLITRRKEGSYHHFRLDRRRLSRFVRVPGGARLLSEPSRLKVARSGR